MPAPQNKSRAIPRWWIWFFALLAVFTASLAVVVKGFHLFSSIRDEPFIQGADDSHYYLWLRSWVVDGDLDFTNDFAAIPFLEPDYKERILNGPRTATGMVPNKFPVGWAVVSAPGFATAHLLSKALGWEDNGFGAPYQLAVWLQQILMAGVGFLLLRSILRRWYSNPVCVLAIMMVWLTSPMVYYQTARIAMVHNTLFVLGTLVFWLALRVRDCLGSRDRRSMTELASLSGLAGFAAGLMVICRPSAIVYLIPPVWLIIDGMYRNARGSPGLLTAMGAGAIAGAAAGVFPQLLAWKQVYGHWIYYSYQGEGFNWASPQFYTSLLSPHHGLFNWHPMLALGLGGLLLASLRGKFTPSWLISFIAIAWINSAWHMVHFGSAFGGRAYEFVVFFATLGMAYALHQLQRRAVFLHATLALHALLACWNTVFMYLFMQGIVSREEPVTWLERFSAVFR